MFTNGRHGNCIAEAMKLSLKAFKQNIFNIEHRSGTFPINANGDYSAITGLTKKQIRIWPAKYFQLYMDYCLAKEIYEVAALIRDMAFIRRIKIEIHSNF